MDPSGWGFSGNDVPRALKYKKEISPEKYNIVDFYFPQNVVNRVVEDIQERLFVEESLGIKHGWYDVRIPSAISIWWHNRKSSEEQREILHNWLNINCSGKWHDSMIDNSMYTGHLCFELEEDAVLFKLTWLDELEKTYW